MTSAAKQKTIPDEEDLTFSDPLFSVPGEI
jgi:hypothetical protein